MSDAYSTDFTPLSFDPVRGVAEIFALLNRRLRARRADGRARVLLLGEATHPTLSSLAYELTANAEVMVASFEQIAGLSPADLLICLELPCAPDDPAAPAVVHALTAAADDLILAPISLLADPLGRSDELAAWLVHLLAAGFVYDPADAGVWLSHGALEVRRTTFSAAQTVAYLSQVAHAQRQEIAISRLAAKQQDDLLAAATRDAQALQPELAQAKERLAHLEHQIETVSADWERLRTTPGYAVLIGLQRARARLAPPHSRRETLLEVALGWARILSNRGAAGLFTHFRGEVRWRSQSFTARFDKRRNYRNRLAQIDPPSQPPPVQPHTASVDIIICVHNALDDVQRCLESVLRHTRAPFGLILVDDGSDGPTHGFLEEFARGHPPITLLRADEATGYTRAANRGLRHSHADFVVLLNSDTIVTDGWLDRMMACVESAPRIGLVGPLSNTASWQSVPRLSSGGDWAENPLPPGVNANAWARQIAAHSGRIYPAMPLLNGFCLLIRRAVIDAIGFFDEEAFGSGYGEENDYCLRARTAGWGLALADDAYVYHAQSRSYSHARRQQLSARAGEILAAKHSQATIDAGVAYCQNALVLEGIRARAGVYAERSALAQRGHQRHAGRRLLFLLPVDSPGGGGNVVIGEGTVMRQMGVDVQIFNLRANRAGFERGYPNLALPVHYGEKEDVAQLMQDFDGVVATWYESVYWMAQSLPTRHPPRLGYYVQDYEPYFFPPQSERYLSAVASYGAAPDLRSFTKTEWNRREVLAQVGVECAVLGPSVDIDRFRPRPQGQEQPGQPLRVAAMVRPHSPRRSPHLTMQLLRRLSHRYGRRLQITIFGVELSDPGFADLPQDFNWRLAGIIDPTRVEVLLAETDIFADFSTYQAMGLTALEAMACGAAVIVPRKGGAASFARHRENALVVDTGSEDDCWEALMQLVEDDGLRRRLRQTAIHDVCRFHLERAAYNILETLFANQSRERG